MGTTDGEEEDRLTTWVISGSAALGLTLIVAAILWSWPPQRLAGLLQLLGLALALLGVTVVRSGLQRIAEIALDAKDDAQQRLALRRHALRGWWARRRSLPAPTMRVGASRQLSYDIHDDLVRRRRATGLGDGTAALRILDAEMDDVQARINAIKDDLATQRDQLRVEIQRETRQGWQLILAGLGCSAIGTAVGML